MRRIRRQLRGAGPEKLTPAAGLCYQERTSMTTRLIVLLLTAGLVGIPVIGVVAPVAAEPFPPAPTSPETVAMPGPQVDSGKSQSA